MTYPLLAILAAVIIVAAGAFGWWRAGKKTPEPVWVAHSGYLRSIPAVARRQRSRRRMRVGGAAAALCVAAMVACLAGLPAHEEPQASPVSTRDVTFCLDVSGSMLTLDSEIVDSMRTLVDHFHGERVSLVLWNTTPLTVFPLTDDYTLVRRQLDDLSSMLKSAYISGGSVWASGRLVDYLKPTTIEGTETSSLIGDGLATCTQTFPDTKQKRSRSLVFVTDNLQQGQGIYTLPQAADLVKKKDIRLYTIYSTLSGKLLDDDDADTDAARIQLAQQTERVGGRFYRAADPGLNDDLLRQISSSLTHSTEKPLPPIRHDDDKGYVRFLAVTFLVALALGWRLRI
ncbi:MAG: VWA domain-containing protein [Actinomycetaceae bacterium]|nr:VWA domain-containing protein [Actinomycetaceae bacterium]